MGKPKPQARTFSSKVVLGTANLNDPNNDLTSTTTNDLDNESMDGGPSSESLSSPLIQIPPTDGDLSVDEGDTTKALSSIHEEDTMSDVNQNATPATEAPKTNNGIPSDIRVEHKAKKAEKPLTVWQKIAMVSVPFVVGAAGTVLYFKFGTKLFSKGSEAPAEDPAPSKK